MPWSTLTDAADTLADAHATLASQIESSAERPLRDFGTSNREMQAMTTIQGNLASMAKDVERAQQKTDRLVGKGERAEAGKVANATSELDNAHSQWQSQAPYVFENLEAVDEARLNLLRDSLTQIQTHEVDIVQKTQSAAEHCLNILLSMQTEDEIKMFALKAASGRPKTERPHRPSVPTPSRAVPPASTSTPTLSQPEDEDQRSTLQEDKRKSRMGGLSRIGTVLKGGRKKEKAPATLAPMAESPERKPRASPFSMKNKFGKSHDATTLEPPQETPTWERPRSPLRRGSEIMEPTEAARATPRSPSDPDRIEPAPQANGTNHATPAAAFVPSSGQGDLADLEPPGPTSTEPAAPEPEKDSEGYSVPPAHVDPIAQAQADAAMAGDAPAPAFNVNIRNAPIREEGSDSDAALANMANKLVSVKLMSSRAHVLLIVSAASAANRDR